MRDNLANNRERWREAQRAERVFWDSLRGKDDGLAEFHHRYLSMEHIVAQNLSSLSKDQKVLDIGSGPIPLVSEFSNCDRYALDPLADFYKREFKSNSQIAWTRGVGEALPFANNTFDFVVAANVLDHVSDPHSFLVEIRRVLKVGSILFVSVHCLGRLAYLYRIMLDKLGREDPYHPFTFTVLLVEEMLTECGFEVFVNQDETCPRVDPEKTEPPRRGEGIITRMRDLKAFAWKLLWRTISILDGVDPRLVERGQCRIFLSEKMKGV